MKTFETTAYRIHIAADNSFEIYHAENGHFVTSGVVVDGKLCDYTADLDPKAVEAIELLILKETNLSA